MHSLSWIQVSVYLVMTWELHSTFGTSSLDTQQTIHNVVPEELKYIVLQGLKYIGTTVKYNSTAGVKVLQEHKRAAKFN